mmetsp:Transcript_4100/g.9195  ORF Transcript_4100/g.9195 Transcript_4100/m.9195 type:complete len:234 (+) Transcript_4100:1287-1988(+)
MDAWSLCARADVKRASHCQMACSAVTAVPLRTSSTSFSASAMSVSTYTGQYRTSTRSRDVAGSAPASLQRSVDACTRSNSSVSSGSSSSCTSSLAPSELPNTSQQSCRLAAKASHSCSCSRGQYLSSGTSQTCARTRATSTCGLWAGAEAAVLASSALQLQPLQGQGNPPHTPPPALAPGCEKRSLSVMPLPTSCAAEATASLLGAREDLSSLRSVSHRGTIPSPSLLCACTE